MESLLLLLLASFISFGFTIGIIIWTMRRRKKRKTKVNKRPMHPCLETTINKKEVLNSLNKEETYFYPSSMTTHSNVPFKSAKQHPSQGQSKPTPSPLGTFSTAPYLYSNGQSPTPSPLVITTKIQNKHGLDYTQYLSKTSAQLVASSKQNIIPGYFIYEKIGAGGSATVYKAKNNLGQDVALKLPKFLDGTLDMSVFNKFESEASMWKKLHHENIAEVYKSGLDPLPYISMELMEGGNLQDLMRHHRLSIEEAVNIMIQMLDAISYAHRMASVHRDLKPENILFTIDGIPKITDWGIGKFMASESATKTVGTKGTLLYSAPEQISKKKFGKIDWSTDVFQLGIVFYEMLTNVNPFYDEDSAGIVGNILYEKVEAPSIINPQIPHELDQIVLKALEKRKEDRWRSADIMYHELKRVV